MIDIKIDFSDFIEIERQLEDYEDALFRNRTLLYDILRDLRDYEAEMFDTWGFGSWRDYYETFEDSYEAENYMEWKEKQPGPGGAADLLVLSGRLRDSLTKRTSDSIVEMSPRLFTFGTSVEYARVQYEGRPPGSKRGPKPPGRKFISWNPRLKSIIDRRVEEYLERRNRRYFS